MNNKLFTTLTFAFLLLNAIVFAQAPQAFSYQAIAANANGTPVVNGTVAVRISVLDNSATGTVLYTETHSKQTNAQGLFNLNIGQGSPTTGTFSGINWGQNAKYVKVELDPAGGTNYVNVGTNQLMSVPYALFADKSSGVSSGGSLNDDIAENKYTNFAFYGSATDKVYAFSQKTGTWAGQSDGSTTITESNGNFAFYGSATDKVYAFNKNTGTWVGQSDGSSTIVASNGNFAFYGSGTDKVYAFSSKTGTWVGQAGGSATIVASNGSFAYYDSGSDKVYAFSSKTGTWVGQSDGTTNIIGSNGSFAFYGSSTDMVYVFHKETGTWVGQSDGSSTIKMSGSN